MIQRLIHWICTSIDSPCNNTPVVTERCNHVDADWLIFSLIITGRSFIGMLISRSQTIIQTILM